MVTPQEVRRREVAEAEVSEARGYLNSSRQELRELRHLAWKLEQMGRNRYRSVSRDGVMSNIPLARLFVGTQFDSVLSLR